MLLKNNLVALRAVEPEDLEFLYKCENDTTIWNVSNSVVPYSRFVLKQYICDSGIDIYTSRQLRLIIEPVGQDPQPVGAIDLFDFDPFHRRAGIGILLHGNENRKRGYAAAALSLLIDYCFMHLGLNQIYCNITPDNADSIKLFTSAGFEPCGIKKKWLRLNDGWCDEVMCQLINPNPQ